MRLEVSEGSHITWALGDPVASDGWGSSRIAMIEEAAPPHPAVHPRPPDAGARRGADETSAAALLDNPRIGVLHLDRRGRILEANDRARTHPAAGRRLVGGGRGAEGTGGRRPAPPGEAGGLGAAGLGGRCGQRVDARSAAGPLHRRWWCTSNPWLCRQPDYGARHTAALVLIVEPGRGHRIDPDLVAGALGLTPMEARVAVWLAQGRSVREMAEATGRTEGSIYWHLKQNLPETAGLPPGGPGAAGAVDHRVRITAGLPAFLSGRRCCRPLSLLTEPTNFGRDRVGAIAPDVTPGPYRPPSSSRIYHFGRDRAARLR